MDCLVKEYIIDMWEIQKEKLHYNDSGSSLLYNSILSLHLGRGLLSYVRMVKCIYI